MKHRVSIQNMEIMSKSQESMQTDLCKGAAEIGDSHSYGHPCGDDRIRKKNPCIPNAEGIDEPNQDDQGVYGGEDQIGDGVFLSQKENVEKQEQKG